MVSLCMRSTVRHLATAVHPLHSATVPYTILYTKTLHSFICTADSRRVASPTGHASSHASSDVSTTDNEPSNILGSYSAEQWSALSASMTAALQSLPIVQQQPGDRPRFGNPVTLYVLADKLSVHYSVLRELFYVHSSGMPWQDVNLNCPLSVSRLRALTHYTARCAKRAAVDAATAASAAAGGVVAGAAKSSDSTKTQSVSGSSSSSSSSSSGAVSTVTATAAAGASSSSAYDHRTTTATTTAVDNTANDIKHSDSSRKRCDASIGNEDTDVAADVAGSVRPNKDPRRAAHTPSVSQQQQRQQQYSTPMCAVNTTAGNMHLPDSSGRTCSHIAYVTNGSSIFCGFLCSCSFVPCAACVSASLTANCARNCIHMPTQ
jgi:hypothetical protein